MWHKVPNASFCPSGLYSVGDRTAMSAALRKLPFLGSLTPSTGFSVEREGVKGGGAFRESWPHSLVSATESS